MAKAKTKAKVKGTPAGTVYDPEYHPDHALRFCLLGATNADLARMFETTENTIEGWLKRRPDFKKAVMSGRDIADAEIAEALHRRARGYSYRAVKIMQYEGRVIREPYTEHYPPDTGAATLWLTNRQPKKWRNKQSTEIGGPNGEPINVQVVRRVIVDPKA